MHSVNVTCLRFGDRSRLPRAELLPLEGYIQYIKFTGQRASPLEVYPPHFGVQTLAKSLKNVTTFSLSLKPLHIVL